MWTRSLTNSFVRIILINLKYRIMRNRPNIIRNLEQLSKFQRNENTSCSSTHIDVKVTAQMCRGTNISFDVTK